MLHIVFFILKLILLLILAVLAVILAVLFRASGAGPVSGGNVPAREIFGRGKDFLAVSSACLLFFLGGRGN